MSPENPSGNGAIARSRGSEAGAVGGVDILPNLVRPAEVHHPRTVRVENESDFLLERVIDQLFRAGDDVRRHPGLRN
jgi:hypothetical protein